MGSLISDCNDLRNNLICDISVYADDTTLKMTGLLLFGDHLSWLLILNVTIRIL